MPSNIFDASQLTPLVNSNVNGYEIDGLPIKMGTVEQRNEIIQLVGELLQSYDEIKVKEIDDIVYQIYGITEYEKPIIEGQK